MRGAKVYSVLCSLILLEIAGGLVLAPRQAYSEVERRELAAYPQWSLGAWLDGSWAAGVSAWYADTVPQRDQLTTAALAVQELRGVRLRETDGEEISFHNVSVLAEEEPEDEALMEAAFAEAEAAAPAVAPVATPPAEALVPLGESEEETVSGDAVGEAGYVLPEHSNAQIEENYIPVLEDFTAASNGIIVTGSGETTRAIMLYGGSKAVTTRYAQTANHYKELMPELNVYVMVIPTAVSYYCPERALPYTGSQLTQINNVMEQLREDVIGIDIYTILGEHREEPIYLRTDHHWAPLGAYYAASQLAAAAGVPYLDLEEDYEEYVVHRYVGSMYMYSQDIRVSANPEDFVWYEPKNVELTTTYRNYALDAQWNVLAEGAPFVGSFFYHYRDGSGGAYCTFMGGDAKITRVQTSTENGRRLLILKDSFGNALPAFLFGSFEEVHVIDSRYFTRNIQDYIAEYEITDLLFANNAFHASTPATVNAYERYLTQGRGGAAVTGAGTPTVPGADAVPEPENAGGNTGDAGAVAAPENAGGNVGDAGAVAAPENAAGNVGDAGAVAASENAAGNIGDAAVPGDS